MHAGVGRLLLGSEIRDGTVDAAATRRTAFVIAGGHALTARHCSADATADDPLWLRLSSPDDEFGTVDVPVSVADEDDALDVAVLDVDPGREPRGDTSGDAAAAVLARVPPVPVGLAGRAGDAVRTEGYPRDGRAGGLAFTGKIVDPAARLSRHRAYALQLQIEELAAGVPHGPGARSAVATRSRGRTSEATSAFSSGSTTRNWATAASRDSPPPCAQSWRRNEAVSCSMKSTSVAPTWLVRLGWRRDPSCGRSAAATGTAGGHDCWSTSPPTGSASPRPNPARCGSPRCKSDACVRPCATRASPSTGWPTPPGRPRRPTRPRQARPPHASGSPSSRPRGPRSPSSPPDFPPHPTPDRGRQARATSSAATRPPTTGR